MTTTNEIRVSALRLFGHWYDRECKPVPTKDGTLSDGCARREALEAMPKRRKQGWHRL